MLVLAVATTLLSACSLVGDGGTVIGFLGEDAAQSDRMRSLVSDLEALPGVAVADGRFESATAQPGPVLEVEAEPAATPEQLAAVVVRASTDYSGEWSAFVGTMRVAVSAGSLLTVTDFSRSDADVAAEITYWKAVEKVVGSPLALELQPQQGDLASSRSRLSAAPSQGDVTRSVLDNYEELLAVEPPPLGPGQLWLPGFSVSGELPPVEYVEVLGDIADEVSIRDVAKDDAEGVEFAWPARPDATENPGALYAVFVGGIEYSTDGSGSPGWQHLVRAAGVLADAGLDRATFSFLRDDETVAFHLGDCADTVAPGAAPDPASADLLRAMKAAGVRLQPDAAPGFCQLWNAS